MTKMAMLLNNPVSERPAFQNILQFNKYIIKYERIGFLKLNNPVSLQFTKKLFHRFFYTKQFLSCENRKSP